MTPRETFEAIRKKPNGPEKKFQLLKIFGQALRAEIIVDPKTLSCAELETEIGIRLK